MNHLWLKTKIIIFLIIAICLATSVKVSEQPDHATKNFELLPGQHYQNDDEKTADDTRVVEFELSNSEMLPESTIEEKPLSKIRRKPPCPNNIFVTPTEKNHIPNFSNDA